jgi:hypothetical protein
VQPTSNATQNALAGDDRSPTPRRWGVNLNQTREECELSTKSLSRGCVLRLPYQRVPPCSAVVGPVLHGVPFHALSGCSGLELGFLVVAFPFEGVEAEVWSAH